MVNVLSITITEYYLDGRFAYNLRHNSPTHAIEITTFLNSFSLDSLTFDPPSSDKRVQERIMRQRGSLREFAGICKFKLKLFVDTGSRFPEKSGNLNFDIFIGAYSYFLKQKCNKKIKQTAAKL